MIFLYYNELIPIAIVAVIYTLISTAHRILLPQMYYSLFCFKYQGNVKKTCTSTSIRIIFTILLTIFFIKITRFSYKEVYLGIFLSCFLNIWPAIIQYRLLGFYKSKEKFIMFLGYISFILFSVSTSFLTVNYLIPSIFENKYLLLFDNTGIGIIATILLYIFPVSFDGVLAKFSFLGSGIDLDTYLEEIKIVDILLYCEKYILDLYSYEIERICNKYDISKELLETIASLEYIYRGRWYYRFLEIILCKYFPKTAIKKDISVGIAQIKISTAKKIKEECPLKFINNLYKPEFNLEICAAYLKSLIDNYYQLKSNEYTVSYIDSDEVEDEDINNYVEEYAAARNDLDKEDIFNYIASNYLCENDDKLNRTVMVYSSILRSRVKQVNVV